MVYQVRLDWLPLPCVALIQPSHLSCLGSSVGRECALQAMCRGFESQLSSSFFTGKRNIQVCYIALL